MTQAEASATTDELTARWVQEEQDLTAATRGLPGSTLALVRWPIAFLIAWIGVGLDNPEVGPEFTLGSGAVIAAFWIVIALAKRGTAIRKAARAPTAERSLSFTLGSETIRVQSDSGHAVEAPRAELKHARRLGGGLLLLLSNVIYFIPDRAMAEPTRWAQAIAAIEGERWPTLKLGWTAGLWGLALLVALYALAL